MTLRERIERVIRTPPMPFQVRGVRFIEERCGRAMIGDDMGLGKTYQAIAWMALHPEARPALIVCPASVKWHWQRELETHGGLESTVLNGRAPSHPDGDIWIINWDILAAWSTIFCQLKPRLLIADEAHRMKDRRSQRTRACQRVAATCPHVLALTGTPIRNRPVEFFPMLNTVAPKVFPSFWKFAMRYCDPKPGFRGRGWDFRGGSNLDELYELSSQVMVRRRKADVLEDLPPKTRTVIPIEIDLTEYNRAKDHFVQWYREQKTAGRDRSMKAQALVRLGALLQLAADAKVDTVADWIADWLEDTDQKLVVFTQHRRILAALRQQYPSAAIIEGATPTDQRFREVERFQTDDRCRLFFGNLHAAGEGITLHAASTVLFAELGWTPAEHDQGEDRVLRIGQTASHVDIYYLVASDTVEEKVMQVIEAKRRIVGRVVDGTEETDVQMVVLRAIIGE